MRPACHGRDPSPLRRRRHESAARPASSSASRVASLCGSRWTRSSDTWLSLGPPDPARARSSPTWLSEFWTRDAGATVIDPHGDLATDILERVPARHADRVHVLRLADRAHPRGFNFLERTTPDQAQLVASEYVQLIHDLWPEFTGPKMQHYLRHALLTTFADPAQQTILELIRVLTDDAFRERYRAKIEDPLLASFWATEWPSAAGRENDASIKAVLNKLGAFVSYDSIRDIVGQGKSTIRPRQIMDAADLLVIDCSQGRRRQRAALRGNVHQPLLR